MALTKIQSIVARLSAAEDAYRKLEAWRHPNTESARKAEFSKVRNDMLLAGLRELAGHDGVTIQELAAKGYEAVPVIIAMVPTVPGGVSARPSFGPKMAEMLNHCRQCFWPSSETQFLQEVKPSDYECIRSDRMIRGLLATVALDHCNRSPDELLDPITSTEMAAFAFPGGLMASRSPESREPTRLPGI